MHEFCLLQKLSAFFKNTIRNISTRRGSLAASLSNQASTSEISPYIFWMLGNDLSNSIHTTASNSSLSEACLRRVRPMNSFVNMHSGRLPLPNQIKFTYILVSALTTHAPWCLTLEKCTPQSYDLEWRDRPHSAVMPLPMCIKGRHMSDRGHTKSNILLPAK